MFFIDRWLLNRESQFSWAVAPTHTKIEQILLPAVRMVLFDQYGLQEDVHYRIYKGRFFKLVLKNYPHEVHFLSGDRPGLFVGSNVACLWITEPGLMVREVYEKGQTRLRCPRAVVRQTILEGTPEGVAGKGGWWAELGDVPGIGYDRTGTSGIQKGVRRLIVETTFNKHLKPSPEEYAQKKIRDVFAYDPAKVISYEKGLFVAFTKGSAYWEWVESRNLCGIVDADPALPLIFGWDFNASPLAWVVEQKRWIQRDYFSPRKEQVVAISESCGDARGLMDGVAEFAARFPVRAFRNTPIEVDGDASGWARSHRADGSSYSMIEEALRKVGYERVEVVAAKANPLIKDRLEKTAALMVYEKFVVSCACRRLIAGFLKTSLREGTWQIEKPHDDDFSHWPDAATYPLYRMFKSVDVVNPDHKGVLGIT